MIFQLVVTRSKYPGAGVQCRYHNYDCMAGFIIENYGQETLDYCLGCVCDLLASQGETDDPECQ